MPENNSPKTFCFFIGLTWNQGPVSRQFRQIAQDLAGRGHQVILLVDHQKKHVEARGVNPTVLSWPSNRPTGIKDAIFLQKLIQKYRPACVIGQFSSENLLITLGVLNKIPCRVAWYHTVFDTIVDASNREQFVKKNRFRLWRKKRVYQLATHIVAVTQAARSDALQNYQLSPEKISVFYNGIHDPQKDIRVAEPDPNKIICASRLVNVKGQDTLIRAMVNVRRQFPSAQVEFVGSGNYQKNYQRLAQNLKVDDVCTFSGLADHPTVLQKMSQAWVTVFPTRAEAFGLVAIESMAVGTPVIASNVGGLPEIIRHGLDGYLVPPDDPETLSEMLITLLKDSDLRDRMGHNARDRFLTQFNIELVSAIYAEKLENFVLQSLQSKGHPRV